MSEIAPLNQELAELLNKGGTAPKIEVSGDVIEAEDLEVIRIALQANAAAQLGRIRSALEGKIARERWEGETDTRDIAVTETQEFLDFVLDWPLSPWLYAYIRNDGPDKVYVAINDRLVLIPLVNGESRTIDHSNADRRIERIFYNCDPGNTASLHLEGQY